MYDSPLTFTLHVCACAFRLAHLIGWGHDHSVKQDKLQIKRLHTARKGISVLFPWGMDACIIHSIFHVGRGHCSPWSNNKLSLPNYFSPFSSITSQQVVEVMLLLFKFFPLSGVTGDRGVIQWVKKTLLIKRSTSHALMLTNIWISSA